MNLWDWIAGRKNVRIEEGMHILLAERTIESFGDRTFHIQHENAHFKGVKSQEVLEFLRTKLPSFYDYTTRVKKFTDRRGIQSVVVDIRGHVGLSPELKRYNPFDVCVRIKTEATSEFTA